MDKSNKLYLKALNEYESGNIDESIRICEESISINIKNRASINLKGLLYYLKGDIKGASSLWKLNSQVNNDEVAKKYLQSLKKDEKNLSAYTKAVNYIKQFRIEDALILLMECSESDYNCINVSNAIATCYIKMGQQDKAINYVNKVIKIDRKNEIALKNKKQLIKYGVSRKKFDLIKSGNVIKKITIGVISLILVVAIGSFGIKKIKNILNNSQKISINTNANKSSKNINKDSKIEEVDKNSKTKNISKTNKNINDMDKQKNNVKTKVKQEKFPYEDLKKSLEQKDYYKLYNYIFKWRNENLSINDKSLLGKSEEVLRSEGVKYFYNNGKDEVLLRKNYKKAIESLLKAYSIGADSYLYQDIIFMLGVSYQNLGDIENALKYFVQYDSSFSKGNYEEEVLYRLVVANKNVNLKKSKEYAQKLATNYPKSQYNNSLVKGLLSK